MSSSHIEAINEEESDLTTAELIEYAIADADWEKLQTYLPDNIDVEIGTQKTNIIMEMVSEYAQERDPKEAQQRLELIKKFCKTYNTQASEGTDIFKYDSSYESIYYILTDEASELSDFESLQLSDILLEMYINIQKTQYENNQDNEEIKNQATKNIALALKSMLILEVDLISSSRIISDIKSHLKNEDLCNATMKELAPEALGYLFHSKSLNPIAFLSKIEWIRRNLRSIERPYDLDTLDEYGNTVLLIASECDLFREDGLEKSQQDIIDRVLELGIDINKLDCQELTTLDELVYNFYDYFNKTDEEINITHIQEEGEAKNLLNMINYFISKGAESSNPSPNQNLFIQSFFGEKGTFTLIANTLEKGDYQEEEEEKIQNLFKENIELFSRAFNSPLSEELQNNQDVEENNPQLQSVAAYNTQENPNIRSSIAGSFSDLPEEDDIDSLHDEPSNQRDPEASTPASSSASYYANASASSHAGEHNPFNTPQILATSAANSAALYNQAVASGASYDDMMNAAAVAVARAAAAVGYSRGYAGQQHNPLTHAAAAREAFSAAFNAADAASHASSQGGGFASLLQSQQAASARRSAQTDESTHEQGDDEQENLPKRQRTALDPKQYKRTGNDDSHRGRQ
ncbi:hypothetical protein N9W34_01110 [Rickettsiales bacterium]|nr:hypothetical protein [Rickettsiales bacterium]